MGQDQRTKSQLSAHSACVVEAEHRSKTTLCTKYREIFYFAYSVDIVLSGLLVM